MSDYGSEPRLEVPSVSKVELTRNAKGDPQWRIVVCEGTSREALDELRSLAIRQHQELIKELLG